MTTRILDVTLAKIERPRWIELDDQSEEGHNRLIAAAKHLAENEHFQTYIQYLFLQNQRDEEALMNIDIRQTPEALANEYYTLRGQISARTMAIATVHATVAQNISFHTDPDTAEDTET